MSPLHNQKGSLFGGKKLRIFDIFLIIRNLFSLLFALFVRICFHKTHPPENTQISRVTTLIKHSYPPYFSFFHFFIALLYPGRFLISPVPPLVVLANDLTTLPLNDLGLTFLIVDVFRLFVIFVFLHFPFFFNEKENKHNVYYNNQREHTPG